MFKIQVSDEKGDTLAETAWVTQTKPRGLSALYKAHVFNISEIPRPPTEDEDTEHAPLTPEEELKVDPRHGKKHEAYRCAKHGVIHTHERVAHDCNDSDNGDPAPGSDLPVPAHGLPVPPHTKGPALLRSPRSGGPHNTNIEQMMAELAVRRCYCIDTENCLCPHSSVDLSYMDRPSPPPSPGTASPRAHWSDED